MMVQAELKQKPNRCLPPQCQVEKVVELSAEEFDDLLVCPLKDRAFIKENNALMYNDGYMTHCLLVLRRDGNDGVLVEAEGYDYARYIAFLFGARDIVNARIRQAAEQIVSEGTKHTSDGRWCFDLGELYERMELVVTEDNGLGEMLLEALQQHQETVDVKMTDKCFDIVFFLDFCKNISPSAQPKKRPPRSPEMLVNKLMVYLAEHDDSEALYQMLHGNLGYTNAEIDSMGFDLAHRFEDEAGHEVSDEPRELEEAERRTREQLVDIILNYLVDAYDSKDLYGLLHDELGMNRDEIDLLGYDLSDYYKREQSMSGPQL